MSYRPGLDITVVNFRTPIDLGRFVRSLADNPPTVPYGVRIFNVAPNGEDIRTAYECGKLVNAKVTGNERNVGYATAVNTCVKRGNREAIAIFNADVLITPGSLDACYEVLMEHQDWGVLGPRQIDSQGRITHGGILGTRETVVFRGWHTVENGLYRDVRDDAPTVMGAAMFVKRACWDELTNCKPYQEHVHAAFDGTLNYGAFLPTFLYFEETFCCYHATEHGWKVVYYGPVTMVHEWHHAIKAHMAPEVERRTIDKSEAQFRAACDAVHGMPYE